MKLMKLLYPNQHCLISKSRLVFLYFCLKKVFQKLPVGLNCLRLHVVRTLPKQLMGKCDTYLYGGGGGCIDTHDNYDNHNNCYYRDNTNDQ